MTKDIASLQHELERWEAELAAVDDGFASEGWQEAERELAVVQCTVAAYRGRILPRLTPGNELAAYGGIIGEELTELVSRLEELRRELIRQGQTVRLRIEVAETLAAVRILGKVAVRLDEAAHRYERSI